MAEIKRVETTSDSARPEEILRDCMDVWRMITAREKGADDWAFLKVIHAQYPRLANAYPIVIRVMVSEGYYKQSIMQRFLRWVGQREHGPAAQRATFMEMQAEYYLLHLIDTKLAPEPSGADREKMRGDILAKLKEEEKDFREMVELGQKRIHEHRAAKLALARRELREMAQEVWGEESASTPTPQ